MGPQVINTEDCIKQTQSQVIETQLNLSEEKYSQKMHG